MLTPQQAREQLLKRFPGDKVDAYVDWNGQYIMDVQPKSGIFVCDSTYSVDKKTGKVSEFSPLLLADPDKFFDTAKLVPFADTLKPISKG